MPKKLPKKQTKPKKQKKLETVLQYDNFEAFDKRVGIITDLKVLKKLGLKPDTEDGRFYAGGKNEEALFKFVNRSNAEKFISGETKKYHIATDTTDGDELIRENDEGETCNMVITISNCVRTVNREAYYLCDGDDNPDIDLVEDEEIL